MTQYSADDEKGEEEESEATVVDNPDLKSVRSGDRDDAEGADKTAPFSNPLMMKRLERARNMMALGEFEWARWDLYDIEKKTSNRDYLRTLMEEYNTAGQFNRSSYIAQISFGGQRAAQGLDGIRPLWQLAYPRAYADFVEKYTKKFIVPRRTCVGNHACGNKLPSRCDLTRRSFGFDASHAIHRP